MSISKDQLRKWQDGLTRAFQFKDSRLGPMPESVGRLLTAEAEHLDRAFEKGYGFRVLCLSYQDFAMRTLTEAPQHGNVINAYNYAMNWAAFRRLRSSWNAYNNGYYEDAASLLRGVLETTMYLSCVLRGCFGFDRMYDFDEKPDLDTLDVDKFLKASRSQNWRLSREIKKEVYGASSGLSEAERKDLEVFLWTHHAHVHRSESTVVREVVEMIQSKRLPPTEPELDLDRASVFCNAAVLISWTHVRVLPYLSAPSQYADEWQTLYRVLDEGFRYYVEEWEKPMKNTFLALIENSYTFDDDVAVQQVLGDTA